jgi:hypothetical protein
MDHDAGTDACIAVQYGAGVDRYLLADPATPHDRNVGVNHGSSADPNVGSHYRKWMHLYVGIKASGWIDGR